MKTTTQQLLIAGALVACSVTNARSAEILQSRAFDLGVSHDVSYAPGAGPASETGSATSSIGLAYQGFDVSLGTLVAIQWYLLNTPAYGEGMGLAGNGSNSVAFVSATPGSPAAGGMFHASTQSIPFQGGILPLSITDTDQATCSNIDFAVCINIFLQSAPPPETLLADVPLAAFGAYLADFTQPVSNLLSWDDPVIFGDLVSDQAFAAFRGELELRYVYDPVQEPGSPIPEPATALLVALGLTGIRRVAQRKSNSEPAAWQRSALHSHPVQTPTPR